MHGCWKSQAKSKDIYYMLWNSLWGGIETFGSIFYAGQITKSLIFSLLWKW